MADRIDSGQDSDAQDRRKKVRRSGKERRDQVRWEMKSPLRRKSPGRRTLDKLLKSTDTDR